MKDLLSEKIGKRKHARGKIRPKKKNPRENSRRASARAVERHVLSVYSGTVWLGSIEQVGDAFTARTRRGRKIGVYRTLKVAADAVGDTAEAA